MFTYDRFVVEERASRDEWTPCEYCSRCVVCTGGVGFDTRSARRYREHYCSGAWRSCARWAVARAIGIDKVPDDLLPNDHDRADTYILEVV